jgi:hypothetical protein
VFGLTMVRTSVQWGQTHRKVIQKNRSTGFNRGRGCFATCEPSGDAVIPTRIG